MTNYRPARDHRMRRLFLCPAGHVLSRSGSGEPTLCDDGGLACQS